MEAQICVDSTDTTITCAAECGEAVATIRRAMDELNACLVKVNIDTSGESTEPGQQPTASSNELVVSCPTSTVKADVLQCLATLRQNLAQLLDEVKSVKSSEMSSPSAASTAADLSSQVRRMLSALGVESCGDVEASIALLQEQLKKSESDRLKQKVELDELRAWKKLETSNEGECKSYAVRLEVELSRLRQSYLATKADKKRLKSEKSDLLQQMKHLYSTLQNKEDEVRQYIDSYEMRLHEYEDSLRQVEAEKEGIEREKWDILIRARESSERSVILRTQLDAKDTMVRALEEELSRSKMHCAQKGSTNGSYVTPNNCRVATSLSQNGHAKVRASESTPSPGGGISPARESLSSDMMDAHDSGLPLYRDAWGDSDRPASAAPAPNNSALRRSRFLHRNSEPDLTSKSAEHKELRRSKRKRAFGSLSKVFSRSRSGSKKLDGESSDDKSQASFDQLSTSIHNGNGSPELSPHGLSDEQLQERQQILDEARGQPMARWRSSAVVAWLEVVLNMSQYAKACMENVKSGRVLMGMSDQEIEEALRMTNGLHRRKLRLAIEEHRSPESLLYPKARDMDHVWVSTVWMAQLGLGQHSDVMFSNLADGRVLNSLTRREIDKMLGINRRFHQASMMYGIDLLRALQFDKQVLVHRRSMCEDADTDPLVWTNQRFIKWARSIDLGEYANNLQNSGVHGAIVVLEPSFSSDAMATALGVPPSRTMIRRHLSEELNSLIEPARSSLEVNHLTNEKGGRRGSKSANSLGRSFVRSSSAVEEKDVRRRRSFKDSLGRALGRRTKYTYEVEDQSNQHHQGQSLFHQNLVQQQQQHGANNSTVHHHHTSPLIHSNSISNISMAVAATQSMTASLTMDLETTTV
ncbi:kazrin-like [Sycon ciliatum]|uniref:kazrin-like n=1 Tax=Sycon ciliatum TaxID=27933 RepID=UPI0031F71A1F